ncbi:MAG TPA: hypothetical protein PLU30_23645, partial [Verrucomicrobiae bacterium]|nr:hypothetical protein [Verrucomicrobiae bacterium]
MAEPDREVIVRVGAEVAPSVKAAAKEAGDQIASGVAESVKSAGAAVRSEVADALKPSDEEIKALVESYNKAMVAAAKATGHEELIPSATVTPDLAATRAQYDLLAKSRDALVEKVNSGGGIRADEIKAATAQLTHLGTALNQVRLGLRNLLEGDLVRGGANIARASGALSRVVTSGSPLGNMIGAAGGAALRFGIPGMAGLGIGSAAWRDNEVQNAWQRHVRDLSNAGTGSSEGALGAAGAAQGEIASIRQSWMPTGGIWDAIKKGSAFGLSKLGIGPMAEDMRKVNDLSRVREGIFARLEEREQNLLEIQRRLTLETSAGVDLEARLAQVRERAAMARDALLAKSDAAKVAGDPYGARYYENQAARQMDRMRLEEKRVRQEDFENRAGRAADFAEELTRMENAVA